MGPIGPSDGSQEWLPKTVLRLACGLINAITFSLELISLWPFSE